MSLKRSEQIDLLFRAILSLESVDECYRFFEDICTIKEILAISQRMEVARLLAQGASYQQTIAQIGASSATISRVKHCLDYGEGGYPLVLARLGETEGGQ